MELHVGVTSMGWDPGGLPSYKSDPTDSASVDCQEASENERRMLKFELFMHININVID